MSEALVLAEGVTVTPTGLTLPLTMGFEDWEAVGGRLRLVEGAVQWCIGDWLNYGERAYGETYAQAIDATGWAYQTVANAAWIAGRVEFSLRRENLSFSHHKEVARLDADDQGHLLREAEERGWTVRQLRDAVRTYRKALAAPNDPNEGDMNTIGPGPSITVPEGRTVEDSVRAGIAAEENGATQEEAAAAGGISLSTYRRAKYVVLVADREDLSSKDKRHAHAALAEMNERRIILRPFEAVRPLVDRIYGPGGHGSTPERREAQRRAAFDRAYGSLIQGCTMAAELDVPYLSPDRANDLLAELDEASKRLRVFRDHIKEYAA